MLYLYKNTKFWIEENGLTNLPLEWKKPEIDNVTFPDFLKLHFFHSKETCEEVREYINGRKNFGKYNEIGRYLREHASMVLVYKYSTKEYNIIKNRYGRGELRFKEEFLKNWKEA